MAFRKSTDTHISFRCTYRSTTIILDICEIISQKIAVVGECVWRVLERGSKVTVNFNSAEPPDTDDDECAWLRNVLFGIP